MPTKKIAAAKKAVATKSAAKQAAPVAKKAAAKSAAQPVAAATFRTKIDVANLAVGAKTVKQLARAFAKLAQTLAKMDESGAVKLEQPVTAKGAHLATTDAKAAKRFGMEEGRAPRGAKTAAPAVKKAAVAAKAAQTPAPAPAPAPAKKAIAKKAAAKKSPAQATASDAGPVTAAADTATPAAKKAAAKKAPAKKAARKTAAANGSAKIQRAAGGESAAAPEAPPATDTPGAEAAAS
ncbi:histone [Azohydromonas lata]|uniref:Histone n=1 Tax=Azohydromonas lata TaxID=45677 RepID=A0ABU5I8X9_9BURK|nr:histone [Azohydromonas lata]MDZ5455076.1 histone [Azohydromonas lata]